VAEIKFALCDSRMMDEIVACGKTSKFLKTIVSFDGTANHDAELDRMALSKSVKYQAVRTGRDDVALLGFTSGTTGKPKATMHFHRDLLIIADGYAQEVLGVTPEDIFVGSPPLAFTFGLGGLAVFPLRFGATATLLETASPPNMIEIIEKYKATICFTAPTAYRVMMRAMDEGADLSSLRCAVSAGETLPAPVYDEWLAKTGKPMLDGIGATEMLHIFISNRFGDSMAACTGKPVAGYEARIVDGDMNDVPDGEPGRLAVRGPTGCRYLNDERQKVYVRDGWNITGDTFMRDAEGYFHFAARNDDMIISSGYNIAGPEVEAALLSHPFVVECGVIGAPDPDRGFIVQARFAAQLSISVQFQGNRYSRISTWPLDEGTRHRCRHLRLYCNALDDRAFAPNSIPGGGSDTHHGVYHVWSDRGGGSETDRVGCFNPGCRRTFPGSSHAILGACRFSGSKRRCIAITSHESNDDESLRSNYFWTCSQYLLSRCL